MDISGANTEASLRFHRFHERLNISIKVQMIGLGLLADEIDQKTSSKELKNRLYRRKGWLWGGMPDWSNPDIIVVNARRDIGQAGLARAFSAFDLFMDEIAADLARWTAFSKKPYVSALVADDDDDRAARFYASIGGTPSNIKFLWPVYRYFRFTRDCVAHRDGLASTALYEAYKDPLLTDIIAKWKKMTGERTVPEIITINKDEIIDINHHHAISASSVLRLIALDINKQVINILGSLGLVYLSARKALLDDQPTVNVVEYGSMLRALNAVLSHRYRVRNVSERTTAATLRALGITRSCSSRFLQIKRQTTRRH